MTKFPLKIQFVSCNSELELVQENNAKPTKGKKEIVTAQTATYRYIFVPQIKSKTPSKKMGTTVEYSIDYLNRLNGFGLIKF